MWLAQWHRSVLDLTKDVALHCIQFLDWLLPRGILMREKVLEWFLKVVVISLTVVTVREFEI